MFEIIVDSAGVEQTIAALTKNIEALKTEMPQELLAWQREDMNRRRNINLTMIDDCTAMTQIWPRGQETPVRRRQEHERKKWQRRLAAPTIIRKGVIVHQAKPILRPELFVKLCERMATLIKGVVPWA